MKNDVVEELFVKYYNDALLYVLSLSGNKALATQMCAFIRLRPTRDSLHYWKPTASV